jgi:hypothetical protein
MRLSVGKILGVARHGLPKDRPLLFDIQIICPWKIYLIQGENITHYLFGA